MYHKVCEGTIETLSHKIKYILCILAQSYSLQRLLEVCGSKSIAYDGNEAMVLHKVHN